MRVEINPAFQRTKTLETDPRAVSHIPYLAEYVVSGTNILRYNVFTVREIYYEKLLLVSLT